MGTLIEVFGHIVFSFTRGVTEHYNPEEPQFTAESFGYTSLDNTGREWFRQKPVDQFIYQEYSDRDAGGDKSLTVNGPNVRVIDACLPEENEGEDQQIENRAITWKRFRPSILHTVYKTMYIGALISLLTASIIGALYMLITYLCYKTELHCQFCTAEAIPIQVQWMRTITSVITTFPIYLWYFANLLFLFRPFQLMGVKGKLVLVSILVYCLDAVYRVSLQALLVSHSFIPVSQKIPLNALFLTSICLQVYLVTHAGSGG